MILIVYRKILKLNYIRPISPLEAFHQDIVHLAGSFSGSFELYRLMPVEYDQVLPLFVMPIAHHSVCTSHKHGTIPSM